LKDNKWSAALNLLKFGLLNAWSVGNKFTAINSTIDEGKHDVFLVTETWHSASTDVALNRCAPPHYNCVDVPRLTAKPDKQNHGGVAAFISDAVGYKLIVAPFQPTKFESVCFSVSCSSATVVVLLIYRPGSESVTETFFTELTKYLEAIALYKCQIVIAGDLNIHTERPNESNTLTLFDILNSFDCVQHVPSVPTHKDGGTLDLIITKSEQQIEQLKVDPPGIIS